MTAQTQDGGRPSPAVDHGERIARFLPALMLVTDVMHLLPATLQVLGKDSAGIVVQVKHLESLIESGVNLLQLRDASLREGGDVAANMMVVGAAAAYFKQKHGSDVGVFVNLGTEIMAAESAGSTGSLGVHLPERPMPGFSQSPSVSRVRHRYPEVAVSKSVHGIGAAVQAERDGADMLVLGTVFPSASHPGGPTIGLEGVREVCAAVKIPVIAIGGITAVNAGDVIRAGASGVAVISAIFDAPDPRTAAAELRAEIDKAWTERTHHSEHTTHDLP